MLDKFFENVNRFFLTMECIIAHRKCYVEKSNIVLGMGCQMWDECLKCGRTFNHWTER